MKALKILGIVAITLGLIFLALHYIGAQKQDPFVAEQGGDSKAGPQSSGDNYEMDTIKRLLRMEGSKPKVNGKEITWADLAQLDYKTGKAPAQLIALESEPIKLPGYMVPLTDDFVNFTEFLVVPDPQACIHAPAPPPNQILYVKTKKPIPIGLSTSPWWFHGKLSIVQTKSTYGFASYTLTLQRLEIYEPK